MTELSFHLLPSAVQSRYSIPVFVCEICGIVVIRTLDPEYPHQISLARILKAADITITEGILRFDLHLGLDYITDLGIAGPKIKDIWINVGKARTIIASLWHQAPNALTELTSPSLDVCWSLYDASRSSMLHNWSLSTITPDAYSTALLSQTVFAVADVRYWSDKSRWVRTGLPDSDKGEVKQDPLELAILTWSVAACQRLLSPHVSDDIADVWTPVLAAVERTASGTTCTSGPIVYSSDARHFETDVVISYERILRKGRVLQDHADVPAIHKAASTRPYTVNVSTQTEDAIVDDVSTDDKACQANGTSPERWNNHLLLWFGLLSGVLIVTIAKYLIALFQQLPHSIVSLVIS